MKTGVGMMRIPKRKSVAMLGAAAVLVVILLWMQGTLGGHRVGPGDARPREARTAPPGAALVQVAIRPIERTVEVPGSIQSRTEFSLSTRIQGAVLDVRVRAGDAVRKGDLVARLDDRDVRARVEQAIAALDAAQAEAERAARDEERMESLLAEKAATAQQVEGARAAARAARAGVERARRAREEAEVFLGEAEVRAPRAAVVTARHVDPGDLAMPGQPLLVLYDPRSLWVEAAVEERLAGSIRSGTELRVRLDGPETTVPATVEEVVPSADPRTRTVLVKASFAPPGDARPGAFARLLVPAGREEILVVPAGAVRRVGQIETVEIVSAGGVLREVAARTGRRIHEPAGDVLEVLAGLHAGDTVLAGTDGGEAGGRGR